MRPPGTRTLRTVLLALLVGVVALTVGGAPAAAGTVRPAAVGVNDYPYAGSAPDQVDRWNFYTRECTSFAAWRINNDLGVPFSNSYGGVHWGNANNWANAARAIGIPVDSNATPGSIAVFTTGTYGHVAYVMSAGGGSMTIEDYNWSPYAYLQHTVSTSGVQFIHFHGSGGATGTVQTGGAGLNVRSGPGSSYSVVGALADGTTVTIQCQTSGETVQGNWGPTDVWDRVGSGQYVSDGFIYTGTNGRVAPNC